MTKSKLTKRLFNSALVVLSSFLLFSCAELFTPSVNQGTGITVKLPAITSRAAAPSYVAYYEVTATCEENNYENTLSTKNSGNSSSVTFTDLEEGSYYLFVEAFSEDGTSVQGSAAEEPVVVKAGETTVANITLPLPTADITASMLDIETIAAVYLKEPATIYNAVTKSEIPYKDDYLVFKAVSSKGDAVEADEYVWTLNGTVLEGTTSATVQFNPYTTNSFVLEGVNVITCVVTKGDVKKSVTFQFTFTETGLEYTEESTDGTSEAAGTSAADGVSTIA